MPLLNYLNKLQDYLKESLIEFFSSRLRTISVDKTASIFDNFLTFISVNAVLPAFA